MTGASLAMTAWVARRQLRRRWLAHVPIALIVALGATATLVSLAAAARTDSAYDRYLERADVGDLLLSPVLNTADIDAVVRDLPGVRAATSDAVFLAGIDEGAPHTSVEVRAFATNVQVLGSVDGRHTAMDRVALDAGREPTGRNEALVSVELADARGIAVGDVLPISFWSTRDNVLAPPDVELPPLRVEHLRVVGIATLPDEVLPDGLYPRGRVIVSRDVAERYSCLPPAPPRDASAAETAAQLAPGDCAVEFPYYSLRVDGGRRGVDAALAAYQRRSAELTAQLPPAPRWVAFDPPSYGLIATTTAQEQARVDRSTQPTSTALGVLGLAAGVVTLVLLGLAIAREAQRSEDDQRTWWQLGLTAGERARVLLLPLLLAIGAGLAVALVAAWWLSPVAPVGSVRSIEPTPARQLSPAAGLGALALAAVATVAAALLVVRSARRVSRASLRPAALAPSGLGAGPGSGLATGPARSPLAPVHRLLRRTSRPAVAEGLRAAAGGGGRGVGLLQATGTVSLTVVVSVLVFGASLSAAVTRPAAYGWPWDVAMMGGAGHGGVDLDAARTVLDARPDVASWTALGLTNATVDGKAQLAVIGYDDETDVDLTMASGRLPAGAHQVALATRTAADLGVGIGDTVEVAGEGVTPGRATVTGLVVLPALGPYVADRTGPGTGLLLPAAALTPRMAPDMVTFLGIEVADGADPHAVAADLRDDFAVWDTVGFQTFDYTAPVRPAEIVNADAMRAVPLLVGLLLGLTGAVGLAGAVAVSVRSRRCDLAVLRALGFTGRQVRNSVRVQALAAMAAALAVGAAIGIVVGRVAWRTFAVQLGVGSEPSLPGLGIAVTVAAALAASLIAAALPARLATRAHPAVTLRTE
jgi:hypothetical protein